MIALDLLLNEHRGKTVSLSTAVGAGLMVWALNSHFASKEFVSDVIANSNELATRSFVTETVDTAAQDMRKYIEETTAESDEKLNRVYLSALRDEILEYQEQICNGLTDPQSRLQAEALADYNASAESPFPMSLLICR